MQALVARYVIPKGDVERARSFSVYARGGTQRSNRPSQIEFSRFSLRSSPESSRRHLREQLPR